MDYVILNHGQVTWTAPELAPASPNYHTTQTAESPHPSRQTEKSAKPEQDGAKQSRQRNIAGKGGCLMKIYVNNVGAHTPDLKKLIDSLSSGFHGAAVAQWSRYQIMAGMSSVRAQYHKRPAG
ncbi:hypothetical protein TNCV_1518741 [Trichonephila clavipes]|nr:hypothetical protein TNCV_1518741 [Trichonephila clavipes]